MDLAALCANYDVRYLCKDNRYATVSMATLTDISHINDPDTPFQINLYIPDKSTPVAYIIYYINHQKKEVYVDLVVNTLRGTGLGVALLRVVVAVAARFHYMVRLVAAPHYPVEGLPDRPALPLYRYYERLGFRPAIDFEACDATSVEFTMPAL